MPRPRLPVVVLSGRLGSGKTTVLNHLLRTGRGRVGVVVNDFGVVDVDALLVAGHVDAARSIAGGCLCCLADTTRLDEALAGLAGPGLDLDVVVVEASGLAEPRQLARMVISSAAEGVRFGGVVEVVDAAAWVEEGAQGLPVAPDHLAVASLVVLHKADRVTEEALARLETVVRGEAPGVPVVRASYGQVDPELVYDRATPGERVGQLTFTDLLVAEHEHDEHHHERHASASVVDPRPTDPRALLRWLETRPPGLYRVKGTTWFDLPGQRGRWVVQAVGGWVSFERGPWPADRTRQTRLVAIGTDLDTAATERDLRALLTSEPLDEGAVTPLLRYCRR